MDTYKRTRNSSTDVSLAAYGFLNVEEGNDYSNLQLESKESAKSASSPNLSDISSFSLSSSSESLSDFSELVVQHPIKRGLSKYYNGKSRTFTSLFDVRCVEDLPKREIPHKKRAHKPLHSPKSNISKKAGRNCSTPLLSKWS